MRDSSESECRRSALSMSQTTDPAALSESRPISQRRAGLRSVQTRRQRVAAVQLAGPVLRCRSTIITTNLAFSEWVKVFGAEKLITVLLDRVSHRAHILTTCDSFRSQPRSTKPPPWSEPWFTPGSKRGALKERDRHVRPTRIGVPCPSGTKEGNF